MSEGGGEPLKNGDVEVPQQGSEATPEVQCPEVDFSPLDENGRPKPFVCICPPKLPDDQEPARVNGSTNGPDKDQSPGDTKADTNGHTKENTNGDTKDNTNGHKPSTPTPPSPAHGSPAPGAETPGSPTSSDAKSLNKSFSEQFKLFSKFGDTKSDGRHLSLSQSDKWMKQAKVIDGKHITTTDTGIHFKKLKSIKVSESDYKKFLEDLAKTKKMNCDDIKKKMVGCGAPGFSTAAGGGKTPSAFERLTDTSKYTGCHKQRFDETGKGRGIAGRKDLHDNSGYVSGYTNKNTYDKKNPTK